MDLSIAPAVVQALAQEFKSHAPYGYAAVGRLFSAVTLAEVAREVEASLAQLPQEADIYASHGKYRQSVLADMPARTRDFIVALNAPAFLKTLSLITGIEDLRADPGLRGGGIHAISRGGFLKLHTDFNWHRGLAMHRRLNLIVYLNRDWQPAWNGAIELWNADATARIYSQLPELGNALLFETNDVSYHGHPDPLACPEGTFRKSLALYYYTTERPAAGLRFGRTDMTNFVARPDEHFQSDRLRWLQQRVQLRLRRIAYVLTRKRVP